MSRKLRSSRRRLNRRRTAVYEFRGFRNEPLYVGLTNSPQLRFRQHAGLAGEPQKSWWVYVDHARTVVTWYPNRARAMRAELALIRRLRPPGNRIGNPDWEKSTWTTRQVRRSSPRRRQKRCRVRMPPWPTTTWVAVVSFLFPVSVMLGNRDVPAALVVGGLLTGAIAVRIAWRRRH